MLWQVARWAPSINKPRLSLLKYNRNLCFMHLITLQGWVSHLLLAQEDLCQRFSNKKTLTEEEREDYDVTWMWPALHRVGLESAGLNDWGSNLPEDQQRGSFSIPPKKETVCRDISTSPLDFTLIFWEKRALCYAPDFIHSIQTLCYDWISVKVLRSKFKQIHPGKLYWRGAAHQHLSTSGDYKCHPVQLAPLLTTERKCGHLVHTWPVESSKFYNPVPWRTFYGVLLDGEVHSTKDIWFFALCLYLSHKVERFFSGCWTPQTSARVKRALHLKILKSCHSCLWHIYLYQNTTFIVLTLSLRPWKGSSLWVWWESLSQAKCCGILFTWNGKLEHEIQMQLLLVMQ